MGPLTWIALVFLSIVMLKIKDIYIHCIGLNTKTRYRMPMD